MKVVPCWSTRNSCDASAPTQKDLNFSSTEKAASEEPFFKCRYVVAFIGFGVLNFLAVHRVNMAVAIVAMVNRTAIPTRNGTISESCPLPSVPDNVTDEFERKEGEFDWSPSTQGYVLSSSFIGYITTLLVSGKVTERFGCKWVLFFSVFLSSLSTFLTPCVAWWNVNILFAVQAVRGMAQGAFQPAISIMTANWFPRQERGSLGTFMQIGQCVGTVVSGVGTGYLCDSDLFGGWPAVFYIFGGSGILMSLLIAAFLHENPQVHPSISKAELDFILINQENALSKRRPDVPWRSLFTSIPFYALCVAFFGMFWMGVHFTVVHPTYLGAVLHFPIDQNGILSSVPFVLTLLLGLGGSWISSALNQKQCVGVDKVRKMWFFAACVSFSAGVLGIYMAGCDKTTSIAFSVFCIGAKGFLILGCQIVPADMSPNFAGTLTGLATTFGGTAGFILPFAVGWLTDEDNSLEQWNKIMFLSIGVAMTSCIVFGMFGSADVQSWNFVPDGSSKKEKKKSDIDE